MQKCILSVFFILYAMANPIDTIITPSAIQAIDKAIAELKELDKKMQESTRLFIQSSAQMTNALNNITPSNVNATAQQNAQLTAQIQAQAQALAQLQNQYNTLSQSRQRNNQQTAEEVVNQRLLNRNALENARINSTLAGAYGRLSAEHQRASRNLQDLMARGRLATQTQREYDRELRNSQREFNTLNDRVLNADRAVGRFNRNVGNYPKQALLGLKELISAFGIGFGLSTFADIAKNIFNTTKELQSLDNALKQVTGTQETFSRAQDFLSGISEQFGIDIQSLTKEFTQFYVSAKDKISGNEIEQIFKSISKAGATMGLSTEQQSRAFMALNQMMSKGTIQAEELRGQLGEALPGALSIMAKALGVSEKQLGEMMKQGQLLAADVLPKFAKQLEITYGIENVNRIDSLAAAQGRMANAWTNFVRSLDKDGNKLSKFFASLSNTAADLITGTELLFESESAKRERILDTLRKNAYTETVNYYNSLDKIRKEDLQNDKAYNIEKAKELTEEFNRLKQRNLILKALQRDTPLGTIETSENKNERIANENRLKMINQQLSRMKGQVQAVNSLMQVEEKHNVVSEKGTKIEKEKVEALNVSIKARGTLNEEIDKQIDRLRTEAILNSEDKQHLYEINKLITQLTTLKNEVNKIEPIDVNIVKSPETVKKQIHEISEELKNFTQSFQSEFFSNSGFSSLNTFITGEFDDILESAETFTEKFAVYFNSIAEVAQDTFNFISEASTKNFDAEKERLQAQYDVSLKYAGDNKAAQEKLADDLEKKKKEIDYREAKAKQKQTLFNIAIDTAQAVVSAVAQSPLTFGLPWSAFALALGATQAALVASQEIPRYWMGGTHDGGLMMVNDGSGQNYKETIVTPDGKIMKPQGRNVIMDAPAGTEIYTHEMWQDKLSEMLQGKGIDMAPVINNNSGLSKSDMYDVLMDTLGSQPQHYSNFDANGATEYIMKGGNKTILNRNRSNGKGQRFR